VKCQAHHRPVAKTLHRLAPRSHGRDADGPTRPRCPPEHATPRAGPRAANLGRRHSRLSGYPDTRHHATQDRLHVKERPETTSLRMSRTSTVPVASSRPPTPPAMAQAYRGCFSVPKQLLAPHHGRSLGMVRSGLRGHVGRSGSVHQPAVTVSALLRFRHTFGGRSCRSRMVDLQGTAPCIGHLGALRNPCLLRQAPSSWRTLITWRRCRHV